MEAEHAAEKHHHSVGNGCGVFGRTGSGAALVGYILNTTYKAVLHAEYDCMQVIVDAAVNRMKSDFVQL